MPWPGARDEAQVYLGPGSQVEGVGGVRLPRRRLRPLVAGQVEQGDPTRIRCLARRCGGDDVGNLVRTWLPYFGGRLIGRGAGIHHLAERMR